MPHIRVEYSANLADAIDVPSLLETLHATAVATGVFPLGGTRTRAIRLAEYRVADGHGENGFVHVTVQMGHGRDLETRKRVGQALFEALSRALDPVFAKRPLGMSLEIQELDPVLNFKKNNLHDYVAARKKPAAAE